MVTFIDAERGDSHRRDVDSGDSEQPHTDLQVTRFTSAAPTLNNTPTPSRNSSPLRKKSLREKLSGSPFRNSRGSGKKSKKSPMKRTPTPCPSKHDIESLDHKLRRENFSRYTRNELHEAWLGVVIVACFFTSGLVDAVAFNSWNCFVNMQTGNTIFAALGIGGLPAAANDLQYTKSFTAIGSFILGTAFFSWLNRLPTGMDVAPTSRSRIIFVTSFFIQTMMIMIAAILVTVGVVSSRPFRIGQFSSGSWVEGEVDEDHENWLDLAPIVLLSFQAAGQVSLSRVLGLLELPTIVLSALYFDFTADLWATKKLWRESANWKEFLFVQSRRQNKRFLSIIALFLGGVVGGEMYKSKAQMAGALWLAFGMKGLITAAFCVWKKQPDDDDDDEEGDSEK